MVKKLEKIFDNQIWNRITNFLFPVLLVLFSFIHINEGITVTDTGYNYGNFVSFDSLDDMWKFSTYLASALGAFFTKLPFGKTMIGLNFYTGLLKIVAALLAYYFCIKVCKIRKEMVFLGEMIALGLCWCPTALIYNYLTYLLFHLAAMFLYMAIVKEKKSYYVFAGIFLGVNLFVRLPNVAEIALIVVVWLAGIIYKKRVFEIVKNTLFCVLGYGIGGISVFAYLVCRYGLKRYVEGILSLFAMTQEAGSYTVKAMIVDTLRVYLQYSKWFLYGVLLIALGMLLFRVLKEKFLFLKKGLFVILMVVGVYLFKRMGMFSDNYRSYESIFGWGVMLLMSCLFLGAGVILSKKRKNEEKVLWCILCVIILITPLGSNNHLYSPMNNLFLVAPLFLNYIWELLSCEKRSIMIWKISLSNSPQKITLVILAMVLFIQSFLFGSSFVFRDGVGGEGRDYVITENSVLKGMYTTTKNGQNLQELNDYLVEGNLIGSDALLFGNVPSCAFYFQFQPVLSSTWPDLPSYSLEKFKAEVDKLREENKTPMILLSANPTDIGMSENASDSLSEKLTYLSDFMEENQYEKVFSNEAFMLYRSK